jgi:hypothetical protein
MNPSVSRQIDRLPFWFFIGCRLTFGLALGYMLKQNTGPQPIIPQAKRIIHLTEI